MKKFFIKTKLFLEITGVILSVILVSSVLLIFNNKKNKVIEIKDKITINVNEKLPEVLDFEIKKGALKKTYKIEYKNLKDTSKVGTYNVTISGDNKTYKSKLIIVDNNAPILKTKDVKVNENDEINIDMFIESCTDNSNEKCNYYYVNENGEKIDDIDKSVGIKEIYIVAEDVNKNKTNAVKANLEIIKKEEITTTKKENTVKTTTKNIVNDNKEEYDPEKGCYTTPKTGEVLAYRFSCGIPIKEAYAKLDELKKNYFNPRISKLMSDNSFGHGVQYSSGYYFIQSKYNSSYTVGISVPFILIDPVDKVSSSGYLKEDGTASWTYYREAR